MQQYADTDNDSGVLGFEIDDTSITVWFKKTEKAYTYSYQSAGKYHVEEMKKLALLGNGLNSYINKNVRNDFVR